jgi:nitrogen fixation protein FixH
MTKETTTNPERQKRSLIPIGLIAFFAVFISFIIGFSVFATRQRMDLVANDYYDQEIKFQQHVDRLNHTLPIKSEVTIDYDSTNHMVTIAPPTEQKAVSGSVQFYRPSDAGQDRHYPLGADGGQRIDTSELTKGLWKVRVQWTNETREYFFEKPIVIASR